MDLKNKTILITGIGGFVGLRAAELAIKRGMNVRGLEYSQTTAKLAQALGAEVIVSSITDPIAVQKASIGADIVLHTAAVVKEGGSLQEFRKVNVDASVNLASVARDFGCKTFVHLSSVMVYGFNYGDRITESGPLRGENNPYCQTKIEGEKEILKLNAPGNFGVIIIRPGDVYGPRCNPWVIRPLELMQQKRFLLPNGGRGVINHVYVDNLIDGIFLAIEKEAYGEAFNITDGQETSWGEYYKRLAAIAGLPKPLSLPAPVIKTLIKLECSLKRSFGIQPDILPEVVDFSTRPYAYSIEKAQSQLGYQPKITLEEGMEYIREWLINTDISKPKELANRTIDTYRASVQPAVEI